MKRFLFIVALCLACIPAGASLMAAPQAPMSKDSDFKEIRGRLVITATTNLRSTTSGASFKWRIVVITPDQKRISFPFHDNGTITHTIKIKDLKKGEYVVAMINDNLTSIASPLPTGSIEIKYEPKKGKFFNVITQNIATSNILEVGEMIRVPYTVFAPAHRSLPLQ